jgi:hypothetical protein
LQELCPQLVVAKTMLAGHFNTIEVADQVNAMLDRFLAVASVSPRPDAKAEWSASFEHRRLAASCATRKPR